MCTKMVNFGARRAEIMSGFLTHSSRISRFFDCQHVHVEVSEKRVDQTYHMLGSEPDFKMYVEIWG